MSYKKFVRRPTNSGKKTPDLEVKLHQIRKNRIKSIARGGANFLGFDLKLVAPPLAMDEYADFF